MTEREESQLYADAEQDNAEESLPPAAEEPADEVPHRVGCRTELRGWAGAHLHGAVRPRLTARPVVLDPCPHPRG